MKINSMVAIIIFSTLLLTPVHSVSAKYENANIIRDDVPSKEWILPKIYGNVGSRYSIKYPEDWQAERSGAGMLVLRGNENTLSYRSFINIQAINSKEAGGKFESVKEFMYSIKYQIAKKYSDARFVGDGSVVLTQLDGKKMVGKYLIFTFSYNGMLMEQWQIVVQRFDKNVFYTWAYTSPYPQYVRDLHLAKMMLNTWLIY